MTDFGRDIWCDSSLRTGRMASGVTLVAQNALHRLTTPRGTLRGGEDEANYGIDLEAEIGKVASDSEVERLKGLVRAELLKDERIDSVEVSITRTSLGASTEYAIAITGYTADGPFDLVLGSDGVTLAPLKLEAT